MSQMQADERGRSRRPQEETSRFLLCILYPVAHLPLCAGQLPMQTTPPCAGVQVTDRSSSRVDKSAVNLSPLCSNTAAAQRPVLAHTVFQVLENVYRHLHFLLPRKDAINTPSLRPEQVVPRDSPQAAPSPA